MDRAEKRRQQKKVRKAEKQSRVQALHPGTKPSGGAPVGLLEELIQKGIQLHLSGRMQDAEALYRQILDTDPDHADANHLMGGLACQTGNPDQAVSLILKAIAKAPDRPMYHYNLGTVYQSLGRLQDAALSCRAALALNPDYVEAHFGLGLALQGLGQLEAADQAYMDALALKPDQIVIHNNRGVVCQALGRMDEAVVSYSRAIDHSPGYAEAHGNLGKAYLEMGRLEESAVSSQRALIIDVNLFESHSNLGNVLQELGQYDAAAACYERAIAIKPDFAEAHSNLGNVLQRLGRVDEAVESCLRAVAFKPDMAEMHGNLGTAQQKLGLLDEALASYRQAITLKPDYPVAWNNLNSAAKAAQYAEGRMQQSPDHILAGLSAAPADQAMFDYYMAAFRPHEADDCLQATMAALAPGDSAAIAIDGGAPGADEAPVLADNIIGLLHFGRSGTGLLHSLIDGHPEITTTPSIYLRGYFNSGVWPVLSAGGWRELPDRFMAMFTVLFDATSARLTPGILEEKNSYLGVQEGMTTLGANRDESLVVDCERFRAAALDMLGALDAVDPLTFLKIVHVAYERSLDFPAAKRTMLYHIHNPENFSKLNFLRQASQARLLMMVREPLQACESWLRVAVAENDYGQAADHIIKMLFAIDQAPFRSQDSVGLRLEDLKHRPQDTMAALCAWIGVADDPCLYEMTAQGKQWWGDPSSPDYGKAATQSPFDDHALKRTVGAIFSAADQLVLATLFYPFSVRFGYREADGDAFKRDLQTIRPRLDGMFDFETAMADKAGQDHDAFMASGAYRLLRAGLLERWTLLDELGDYPHMLTPLELVES